MLLIKREYIRLLSLILPYNLMLFLTYLPMSLVYIFVFALCYVMLAEFRIILNTLEQNGYVHYFEYSNNESWL